MADEAVGPARRFLGAALAACVLLLAAGCATEAKRAEQKGNVDYHYSLGMAALEDNNLQGALVEFRAARKLDRDDPKVLFALGHTAFRLEDYAGAEQAMLGVLKIKPDDGDAINYLGNIYEQQGRLDEAVAQFKKAIAAPTYATPNFAYRNLARVELKLDHPDEAETALKAALLRVPEYFPARADLAKLYMDRKRWAEAVETWRALLDLSPAVADAHYYLALSYLGQADADNARRELTAFLAAVDDEHPLAAEARSLLGRLGGAK